MEPFCEMQSDVSYELFANMPILYPENGSCISEVKLSLCQEDISWKKGMALTSGLELSGQLCNMVPLISGRKHYLLGRALGGT
jgi:hypothetical protein